LSHRNFLDSSAKKWSVYFVKARERPKKGYQGLAVKDSSRNYLLHNGTAGR